jgi:O-antigen/teichoic acid export membrane protein
MSGPPTEAVPPPGDGEDVLELIEDVDRQTHRRGLSYAVSSFMVNGVIGLVGAVITSRIYGVDVMGEYALVVAPWLILITLSSVAEQVALVRELAGLPAKSPRVTGLFLPVLGFSFLLTLVVGSIVMGVTVALFRGPTNQPQLVLPALGVVLAYLFFDNTSLNLDGVFSAFRAGRELFIGRTVQLAGFPVLAIALASVDKSVGMLTLATIGAMALSLLVRLVFARRYLAIRASGSAVREGIGDLPELLRFGAKVVPTQLVTGMADQASTWVLSALLPISAIGGWARSYNLANRLQEAGWRINEILYATLVQRHRDDDSAGFCDVLARTTRITGVVILLPASVAAGAAEGILQIFGPGFDEAAGAFAVLTFTVGVGVIAMGQGIALVAAGKPHLYSVVGVSRAVVGLALLVPFAVVGETVGAATALAVAMGVQMVLTAFFLVRRIGRASLPHVGPMIGLVIAAGIGFAGSRCADVLLDRLGGTVVALGVGSVAYAVVIWLGVLHPEERTIALEKVRSTLRRS